MAGALTIGIDARAAQEVPAGRGRYVRELLRGLARNDAPHRFVLYARERWDCPDLDERFTWEIVPQRDPLWHLRAAARASRSCDVFLSTNSYLTAWFLRVPSVVVVFDMVTFDPSLRGQRRAGWIERATLRPAVARATRLTAISQATLDDLVARYPGAAGKTQVITLAADASFTPQGPDDAEVLQRLGVVRPYLLATGTLEPRKNLPRLIEAFAGLPDAVRGERRLVLAGPTGWEMGETLAAIERAGDLVQPVGRVDDADLPALYRGAELFCYPSIYEGFGLPVLEAMACGTPVLTSDVSSLPEVGGDAALYADPRDVASIRARIAEAIGDPGLRERLSARGIERAAQFSWDRTAAQTLELLAGAAH